MLLKSKFNVLITFIVLLIAIVTFLVSKHVLTRYFDDVNAQKHAQIIIQVEQDVFVFDNLLALVEKQWERELATSLPKIAQEINTIFEAESTLSQEQLNNLRSAHGLSDLHIINSDLVVFASTFSTEVGLDLKEYGKEYAKNIIDVLKNSRFFTHRVSLSTATGKPKKYAYYSAANSQLIINGDIDLESRLQEGDNGQIAEYLFGDYATKLSEKYQSISFIDVYVLSDADQWSIFNTGDKLEESLARSLFSGESTGVNDATSYLKLVGMKNYNEAGFKTFLRIEFDTKTLDEAQLELSILLLASSFVMAFLSFLIIKYALDAVFMKRFRLLFSQVKAIKNNSQSTIIGLKGSDEIASLSNEINNMLLSLANEQGKNKVLLDISEQDVLTKIGNRRALDNKLTMEWKKASVSAGDLSVLMIDIDYFKDYNDLYGHVSGDKCLQSVAKCLNEQLARPSDFIARYGGEEFVCVLSDTDLLGANNIAQQMKEAVAQLKILHGRSDVADIVTISIGVLSINGAVKATEEFIISQVDKLLYTSKQQGRNQITAKSIVSNAKAD